MDIFIEGEANKRIRNSVKEIIEQSDQNNLSKFKWALKK